MTFEELNRQLAEGVNILELLEPLERARAEMPDPLDLPGNLTQRERHHLDTKRAHLNAWLADARPAIATIAQNDPRIAALIDWRDNVLLPCEKRLCDEMMTMTSTDNRMTNYKLSLGVLRRGRFSIDGSGYMLPTLRLGQLLRDLGYVEAPPTEGRAVGTLPWYGSLAEVEHELRELHKQRNRAARRLAGVLEKAASLEEIVTQALTV